MPEDSKFQGNLLTEPLISVATPNAAESLSLPEVLSRLGRGDHLEFIALRPHQEHPWFAFLVQLAALIAHRSGATNLNQPADWWQASIRSLSPPGDAAWCLVGEDLAKPAFMQTPVPEGSLAAGRYAPTTFMPDEIDTLITTRNHDVKQGRICYPRPEHWTYALISLQTMQGVLGRGKYGIARMNTGFGSRPAFAAAPGIGWADRFRRDVAVWLETRDELVMTHGYRNDGGLALLWLEPWDGEQSHPILDCDPFFIEVCRRIRLLRSKGQMLAYTTSTRSKFLESKQLQGDTGDIWMPVSRDGKALTVGSDGLSYRLMTKILFGGDYPRQPALRVREYDGSRPFVVARVLVRGQGTTDGYRERVLPIPPRVRSRLLTDAGVDQIRTLAQQRVERAKDASRKVLLPSLCTLLQGGIGKLNLSDKRTNRWTDQFDQAVDDVFFDDLWEAIDLPQDEAEKQWDMRLGDLSRSQLEDAIATAPTCDATRYRSIAYAESRFLGSSRKYLPAASREKKGTEATR